jgi:hypothetical protein
MCAARGKCEVLRTADELKARQTFMSAFPCLQGMYFCFGQLKNGYMSTLQGDLTSKALRKALKPGRALYIMPLVSAFFILFYKTMYMYVLCRILFDETYHNDGYILEVTVWSRELWYYR